MPETARSVIILGAAGRDFHNFNVFFRDNPRYRVVAFTAAQIPNIACRSYPAALCGTLYPDGIQVFPETDLTRRLPLDKPVARVSVAAKDLSTPTLARIVLGRLADK